MQGPSALGLPELSVEQCIMGPLALACKSRGFTVESITGRCPEASMGQ